VTAVFDYNSIWRYGGCGGGDSVGLVGVAPSRTVGASASIIFSCSIKIQKNFFWYRPTRVVADQRPLNGCVCEGGPVASTPYQGVAPRQLSFSSPGSTISGSFIAPTEGHANILFSYKHRGLCLYLARILRWVLLLTTVLGLICYEIQLIHIEHVEYVGLMLYVRIDYFFMC